MECKSNFMLGEIKSKNPISRIGIGPMSSEVIEAVFRYSEKHEIPLMLVASKNQVDWDGGYVNQWKTDDYMAYVKKMRQQYAKAKVYICRDHCGPGFKNDNLADVYKTIDSDIENGFDLIHVDFCRYKGERQEIFNQAKKAVEYIYKKSSNILIEVGMDENKGDFLMDSSGIEEELRFFTTLGPVHFFVLQTGSLIMEINQVGKFNKALLKAVRPLAKKYKVFFKEHNCDYLSAEDIAMRRELIDAINIAPQYGIFQTMITLEKALLYGIDPAEFLNDAYASKKWEKWLYVNTKENRLRCSIIAGHYVFAGDAYQRLYNKINKHENLRETIIGELMKSLLIYATNF